MGVLVLSQFFEESYAIELIGDHAEGVCYLLKEKAEGKSNAASRRLS